MKSKCRAGHEIVIGGYSWSWLFLMECTPEKARRNTLLKHRLAAYSQTVLKEIVADETIDYNRSERGILYFHRDQQALDRGVEHMKLLESDGQVIKVLDRDAVVALEPSLASAKSKIAGGIYCPTDETGESAKFARALAAKIVVRGGEVHTGTAVIGLETDGDSIAQALSHRGAFKADAFVLALGAESPILVRKLGIQLPIYPIKGYSLTIPIGNRLSPPTIASVDEHNLVAVSRFGDRIRVTATAEFAGYELDVVAFGCTSATMTLGEDAVFAESIKLGRMSLAQPRSRPRLLRFGRWVQRRLACSPPIRPSSTQAWSDISATVVSTLVPSRLSTGATTATRLVSQSPR